MQMRHHVVADVVTVAAAAAAAVAAPLVDAADAAVALAAATARSFGAWSSLRLLGPLSKSHGRTLCSARQCSSRQTRWCRSAERGVRTTYQAQHVKVNRAS